MAALRSFNIKFVVLRSLHYFPTVLFRLSYLFMFRLRLRFHSGMINSWIYYACFHFYSLDVKVWSIVTIQRLNVPNWTIIALLLRSIVSFYTVSLLKTTIWETSLSITFSFLAASKSSIEESILFCLSSTFVLVIPVAKRSEGSEVYIGLILVSVTPRTATSAQVFTFSREILASTNKDIERLFFNLKQMEW